MKNKEKIEKIEAVQKIFERSKCSYNIDGKCNLYNTLCKHVFSSRCIIDLNCKIKLYQLGLLP